MDDEKHFYGESAIGKQRLASSCPTTQAKTLFATLTRLRPDRPPKRARALASMSSGI
jgi:hypothetical protein